ncbi:hypothetical protein OCD70_05400 [Bacillus tropicus]|uniref:hypothetical protein n=1 Tax=Bacillus tropicus TaxID=2026188 RepID=UPI0021D199A2|nr:hypothetical protein [Bacillus tropicus]MCU4999514.1 hypothetical protein [Bacillus tropicus]
MKIKPLERIVVESDNDLQITRLPNNEEMVDKINEIIRVVNELDAFKSNQSHQNLVKQMTSGW